MGYDYKIDVEKGILLYSRYGAIEKGELYRSTLELLADKDFEKIEKILVDMSRADFSAVPYAELVSYGEFSKANLKQGKMRMAIIAPADLSFGVARVYESFASENDNVQVFRDEKTAMEWLEEEKK